MKLIIYKHSVLDVKSPYGEFTGTCAICGKQMSSRNYAGQFGGVCSKCFGKAFDELWLLNKQAAPNRYCIINGKRYCIQGVDAPLGTMRGCGGAKFFIRFFDDPNTIVETNNLWSQGDVPADDPRFGDNAEFLTAEKVQELCKNGVQ